jgi:hypothetical protein
MGFISGRPFARFGPVATCSPPETRSLPLAICLVEDKQLPQGCCGDLSFSTAIRVGDEVIDSSLLTFEYSELRRNLSEIE